MPKNETTRNEDNGCQRSNVFQSTINLKVLTKERKPDEEDFDCNEPYQCLQPSQLDHDSVKIVSDHDNSSLRPKESQQEIIHTEQNVKMNLDLPNSKSMEKSMDLRASRESKTTKNSRQTLKKKAIIFSKPNLSMGSQPKKLWPHVNHGKTRQNKR